MIISYVFGGVVGILFFLTIAFNFAKFPCKGWLLKNAKCALISNLASYVCVRGRRGFFPSLHVCLIVFVELFHCENIPVYAQIEC